MYCEINDTFREINLHKRILHTGVGYYSDAMKKRNINPYFEQEKDPILGREIRMGKKISAKRYPFLTEDLIKYSITWGHGFTEIRFYFQVME
jgi:hypothetical protein